MGMAALPARPWQKPEVQSCRVCDADLADWYGGDIASAMACRAMRDLNTPPCRVMAPGPWVLGQGWGRKGERTSWAPLHRLLYHPFGSWTYHSQLCRVEGWFPNGVLQTSQHHVNQLNNRQSACGNGTWYHGEICAVSAPQSLQKSPRNIIRHLAYPNAPMIWITTRVYFPPFLSFPKFRGG